MAQSIAKGDLALTIDELELEAILSFSPSPNGAEWTADKVLRVLMDARIGGFNQKRAEDLVSKFSRAKAALTEKVAVGQAPENPVSEEPEWSELPVPEDLAEIVSAVLSSAPPPVLYRLSYETIKTEKTVKKPAALPFLPPKIEKVVVTERREKRESVYPDPTVVSHGYARKGDRLCLLSQAKPGKAGRTIFGKPLQARSEDGVFYSGAGVARNKTELLAEEEGLVRMGSRWVDVVPIPIHRWSVDVSPDGASFFLSYAPGDSRLVGPTADEVLARAAELGAPVDGLIPREEVAELLGSAVTSGESLFSRSISLDRDAKIEITVSPDKLRASLSIWKGRGRGRPLELSALSAAIKASGVRGFKPDQLKKDVLDFYKGPDGERLDYSLAEGRPAGRGRDRSLAFAVTFLGEDRVAAIKASLESHPGLTKAVKQLDEFPIGSATRVAQVQLGQRIGELPSATAGQSGTDVFGAVIPSLQGNDPAIKVYEDIDFSRGQLTSTASGILLVGETDGEWRLRVVRLRDSSVEVFLAPDAMSASITLGAEEGLGLPLTVERVIAALNAKGIVSGIEPFSVAEAVAEARAGDPVLRYAVARGRQPLPAGGAKIEWLAQLASGALYKPAEGGRVDFKERDTMTRVSEGDPILKVVTTGGLGEDGMDLLGRVVKAGREKNADKALEHDETVREEKAEDGSVSYIAAASGELLVQAGRVSVRARLAIPSDLGPETGNIRFPGAVQVAGSVISGFTLMAGGDVSIGGAIEASLVSSEGSIAISGGVKGARKATIRARKGIEAAFAEQALLLAVEDIRIKNACILCNVKTNGKLVLSSEKAALIGGLCRARKGIDVSVLGSENYKKTEVSFGQDYLVADQIEAEEREIEKLKGLIVQADRAMADLERAGAGLDRIRLDKVKMMKLLEKRTHRVFDLREKFEEHVASEVRVRGTVFPGVIIESHNRFLEVRSQKTKVVFAFDMKLGRIIERPM